VEENGFKGLHARDKRTMEPFVWTKPVREILAKFNRLPVPSV
jgi:hypothetical protein